MRRIALIATVILLTSSVFAQRNETATQGQQKPSPAAVQPAAKAKELPAQEKLARDILTAAEGEYAAFDPVDRAILCHQNARGMMKFNHDGARDLLHRCMQATEEMAGEKELGDKQTLQGWIVQLLLTYGPEEGEELLPRITGSGRERVRGALMDAYVKRKNWDRAIELVRDVQPGEEKFPYVSAAGLMTHLPDERKGDVVSLFSFALNDFHQRKPEENILRFEDMGSLLIRFWRHLPPEMALSAVDELLAKAKEGDEKQHDMTISFGNKSGSATFNSTYEMRVFQMLPILRELDKGRADALERDMMQMKALMNRYPNGMQSIAPTLRDTPPEEGEKNDLSMSLSDSKNSNPDPDAQLRVQMSKQMDDIIAAAERNPKQAIAQAISLPVITHSNETPRARTLEGIAQAVWKKNPSAAKEAVAELVKAVPDIENFQSQMLYLVSAANILFKIEDKDSAARVINMGMALGKKRYEIDTKAGDPNKAPKPFWPSAGVWRQFIQLSRQLSVDAPLEAAKEIQDPEIQLFTRITLANAMLGLGDGIVSMRIQSKNNNMWSMSGMEKIDEMSLPKP